MCGAATSCRMLTSMSEVRTEDMDLYQVWHSKVLQNNCAPNLTVSRDPIKGSDSINNPSNIIGVEHENGRIVMGADRKIFIVVETTGALKSWNHFSRSSQSQTPTGNRIRLLFCSRALCVSEEVKFILFFSLSIFKDSLFTG